MERSLTKYINFRFNSLRKYMLTKYFEYFDILFQFNSATKHYNNEQRPENVRKKTKTNYVIIH